MAIPYSDRPQRQRASWGESFCFIDTETIPTQRADILEDLRTQAAAEATDQMPLEQILDAKVRETSLNPAFGQLAVISFAVGPDMAPINIWDSAWAERGYEQWVLAEFSNQLARASRGNPSLVPVGHNVEFDRGFIRCRSMVHRMQCSPIFSREVKPWEMGWGGKAVDTMVLWSGGDNRNRIKQDTLCKALGLDGKGHDLEDGEYIDGSMVWDFIRRGEIRKVATYCGGDVSRARNLARAMYAYEHTPPDLVNHGFTPVEWGQ